MPKGVPTAEQLMSGNVGGFSIDTCIFESLGFRLDAGEFGILHRQLPPWLKLYLPSVIKREVIGHQVANVLKYEQELQSGLRNIHRLTGLGVDAAREAVDSLELFDVARLFEAQLDKLILRCRGRVLTESGDKLLHEMFGRYFDSKPPFGVGKDKKHEFPDAASLLALEQQAKKLKQLFIVVSRDGGWIQFCEGSDCLFCVTELRDLTSLYQADPNIAAAVEEKVSLLLGDASSRLYQQVEEALKDGVPDCSWVVDAFTGSCSGIDAELEAAAFQDFDPDPQSFQLWVTPGMKIGVAELELDVQCEFDVTAEFSTWDSIDHESIPIGTGAKNFSNEVRMTLYLSLHGNLAKGDPLKWEVDVALSHEDYWVDAGEMEPDYDGYDE